MGNDNYTKKQSVNVPDNPSPTAKIHTVCAACGQRVRLKSTTRKWTCPICGAVNMVTLPDALIDVSAREKIKNPRPKSPQSVEEKARRKPVPEEPDMEDHKSLNTEELDTEEQSLKDFEQDDGGDEGDPVKAPKAPKSSYGKKRRNDAFASGTKGAKGGTRKKGTSGTKGKKKRCKKIKFPISPKMLVAIGVAIIGLVVTISAVKAFQPKSVDITTLYDTTVERYSTIGNASASLNENKVNEAFKDIPLTDDGKAYVREHGLKPNEYLMQLLSKCRPSFDKISYLSNGDKITLSVYIPKDVAESFMIHYNTAATTSSRTIKVSGLVEAEKEEVFNGKVNMSFSGAAPYGEAKLKLVDASWTTDIYTIDQTEGLSNGDTVTVTITDVDDFYQKQGKIPMSPIHEYTVTGLPEYVTDIDLKDVLTFTEEAKEAVRVSIKDYYTNTTSTNLVSLDCMIFSNSIDEEENLSEDGEEKQGDNNLVLVYSVPTHATTMTDQTRWEGGAVPEKIYYPVLFAGITRDSNGKYSARDHLGLKGETTKYSGWILRGCTNIDDCKDVLTVKDNIKVTPLVKPAELPVTEGVAIADATGNAQTATIQ